VSGIWRIAALSALAGAAALGASGSGAQAGAAQEASADAGVRRTLNAPSRAPKTVEIKMMNDNNEVRFEPKDVTVIVGDTIKWSLVGGRHNVEFWPDSVPAAAVPLLRAAMKDTVAPLQSPRLGTAGESYSVVFTGFPKGVYKYFCRPHLMRMMMGTITVE
jgi:plastocyanin